LTTSAPRRTPPSRTISTPTAAAIAGRTLSDAGLPSRWLPPWLERRSRPRPCRARESHRRLA
jgi:hypothetical protein